MKLISALVLSMAAFGNATRKLYPCHRGEAAGSIHYHNDGTPQPCTPMIFEVPCDSSTKSTSNDGYRIGWGMGSSYGVSCAHNYDSGKSFKRQPCGSSSTQAYDVFFQTKDDGKCWKVSDMYVNDHWYTYHSNKSGADYTCMGRCGPGCAGYGGCHNFGKDCMKHDVCSYFVRGSAHTSICDEYKDQAVDEWMNNCGWFRNGKCLYDAPSCND